MVALAPLLRLKLNSVCFSLVCLRQARESLADFAPSLGVAVATCAAAIIRFRPKRGSSSSSSKAVFVSHPNSFILSRLLSILGDIAFCEYEYFSFYSCVQVPYSVFFVVGQRVYYVRNSFSELFCGSLASYLYVHRQCCTCFGLENEGHHEMDCRWYCISALLDTPLFVVCCTVLLFLSSKPYLKGTFSTRCTTRTEIFFSLFRLP